MSCYYERNQRIRAIMRYILYYCLFEVYINVFFGNSYNMYSSNSLLLLHKNKFSVNWSTVCNEMKCFLRFVLNDIAQSTQTEKRRECSLHMQVKTNVIRIFVHSKKYGLFTIKSVNISTGINKTNKRGACTYIKIKLIRRYIVCSFEKNISLLSYW